MRKFIPILFAFFLVSFCYAQEKTVRVTMKSGTTITGTAIEINPASHIVVRVAGFDSKIDMSEIASIEDLALSSSNSSKKNDEEVSYLDQGDYPESYSLQVGPYTIEMVLIRGNQFEMGYDGKGSLSMNSEPVHLVQLSSFYVNKDTLDKDVVSYLMNGKENQQEKHRSYYTYSVKNALAIAEAMASKVDYPVQLISEAQCEYILISDNAQKLDIENDELVFCCDRYSEYTRTATPQVDPIGPLKGKEYVVRNLSATGTQIYRRFVSSNYMPTHGLCVRISVPAKAITGNK